MMKILMITAFLVFGFAGTTYAGGGQKEPTYPPYCWAQPAGSELWFPCGSEEAKIAHCANLMETAMIAIDPYVAYFSGEGELPTQDTVPVLKQWNRIKHECWKEFESERLQGSHLH